ncbi:MAG TPA: hypothetical protein DEF79_02565 [Gammaproteobacteria bacterium]|nr:hypothetical protein [Gammaproteobacteria bacterium]
MNQNRRPLPIKQAVSATAICRKSALRGGMEPPANKPRSYQFHRVRYVIKHNRYQFKLCQRMVLAGSEIRTAYPG